jgi:hypothetical protein
MALKDVAKWFTKSWGMIVLGIWLLLTNLPPLLNSSLSLPSWLLPLLGVVAAVLILIGR